MRDILDALESIHTNKKKPMDIKKEMNKKPAVMKALSLEDTEELEEGVNDVDKILQLTNELYNELVDFQNEETDENVEDLIGHLAEFKAKLEGDTGSFSEPAMPGEYESKESVEEGQYDGKSREELLKMKADAEADIKNMQSSGDGPQEKFYDETQMMMAQQHLDAINDALESLKEEQVEEDCSCETELTNSEEQTMETNQKDTVEVAVEDLARVLELAGLGKEIVKAEAEATTEAPNEVELDEYSNSPDEDYFDADTQLNKLSGGLNGPKAQHKKEYPGDNPLAVELEQKLAKILADM